MNRRWAGWLLAAPILIAGCAQRMPTFEPKTVKNSPAGLYAEPFSGRIVLRTPHGRETALFILEGDPSNGRLQLDTPLGAAYAWLAWTPQGARWQRADGVDARSAASAAELMREALGWALPLEALFAWLRGTPAPELPAGIAVDLSERESGRISVVHATEGWSVLIQLEASP
jgi:outer membrane lipoprotein LolB